MSLFSDLFGGGYQDAANAQIAGLNAAQAAETPLFNTAVNTTNQYGAAALAPYTDLTTTAGQGTSALSRILGLTGNPQDVVNQLAATPGYQFQLQQGERAVDRGASARGMLTSGNTMNAENQYAQGLAQNTYQNYVNSLQPYLNLASNAAQGTANVNLATGGNLAGLYANQGSLLYNTQAGIGNATAAADTAAQNATNSFIGNAMGLGTKLLGYGMGAKVS